MAILTPTQDQGKPAIEQPVLVRQFHFWYAIEDTRTGQWAPFTARIESDNLFDALRGIHESHYWRCLFIWNVEFTPVVEQ